MKAVRFFSDPGRLVSDGNTGLPMFKFDEKGEYVTLDMILAQRMAAHFGHEEIELMEGKDYAKEEGGRANVRTTNKSRTSNHK